VNDGFVPLCDNLIFSGDRGLELFNLSNLPVNVSMITLGYIFFSGSYRDAEVSDNGIGHS
jgi:hypothetical protein